jgi:hypothetical protein
MYHRELGPDDAHAIQTWVYDTIADRDAHNPSEGPTDAIVAEDVALKRVCFVKVPAGFYFLSNFTPITWTPFGQSVFGNHHVQHEDGGLDEISVAGLSGKLADEQTPEAHAANHEVGGTDELDLTGLSGVLADEQDPQAHALDPGSGKHTGPLPEASVTFGGSGHNHSGGASGALVDWANIANKPASFTPSAHASSHQNGGSDELDLTGLSGVLADPQPVAPHPLDPTGGDHTGTLAETSVLFSDTGHDHTGGTEGQNIPLAGIGGFPSNFSRGEQPAYTNTTNKVIGPLASSPVAAEVALAPLKGVFQEQGVDFTVREVTGGTADGWYVCIDPTSSAPGGGSFAGGLNPTTGLTLSPGDKVQLIYPTYPAP